MVWELRSHKFARCGQKKRKKKKKSGTETFEMPLVLNDVQDSGDGHVSQQ